MALLRTRLALLLPLTLVAVPGCASDSEPVVDAIDPGIEFTAASGLEVRMVPDPGSGLFASNVFVGAGSTREDDRTAGSSHFLEHLLFNGTERRTQEELYADVDRIGAYNNATTKLEYTHYMMVAPKEEFDAALDIQADMLLHSTLPPDKFEKERGIVLEEMARAADDPDRLRRVTMVNALYGAGSDFARPVLGTQETIANLRRDDVLAYYQRQYVPSNMKLLLMGDFDPDAARATIERLFETEPGDAVSAPEYPLEERSWMHERRIENDAVDLMIEIPAPEIGHEDYASMMLLTDALGGGDSARLARAMNREPAIEVLEIGATVMDFEGTGVLRINARLPLDTDVDAALERIFGEVATLSTTGLRASEWAGARNRALGQSIRQAEQLHYYALLQGDRIWHGPPGYERRLQVELEASYPRIPDVAARWLGAPVVSVVVAGPDQDDSDEVFDPTSLDDVPRAGARYLLRALAGRDLQPRAVRLRMHGQIDLGSWRDFEAEEVIHPHRGMVWRARTRMAGLPIRGFDRLVDGQGTMRWRILGVIPVRAQSGPDVTRSARGRLAGETVWLPSLLCPPHARWTDVDPERARVRRTIDDQELEVELRVDHHGRLRSLRCDRWGDPDGEGFREAVFGAIVEDEASFDGVTIPSRLRAGWNFDGEDFADGGEFFRVTVDDASYR